jgi:1,4-alpha-glucan branching enzyme
MRKVFYDQQTFKMITPSEYLELFPKNQVVTPTFSSWGYKGYAEFWLNNTNDWIYRHLHKTYERMKELCSIFMYKPRSADEERALKQAAREILLAQSSDWAFIMRTDTTVQYAVKRTLQHIFRFTRLYEMLKSGNIDAGYLAEMEWKDNIFPDVDWTAYA